jgi:hypothetical protein
MTAKTYAALIFAIVALLQLTRAASGWSVTVDTNISVQYGPAGLPALSQLDWPGSVSLHHGPKTTHVRLK